MIITLFIGTCFQLSAQTPPPEKEKTFTVIIDPGHGGKHPGAVGKISKEKDIVLAIALKTGGYIRSRMSDVEVIYTRTSDTYVDLYKRADIANDANADLFISIHANGNNNSSIYGAETYVMGSSKSKRNLDVAIKENSVINSEDNQDQYEGFNPEDPADYIRFSLVQYEFINQSLSMASQVQDQLRIRAKRKDGGVRQGPFLVLWRTTMPSVLIETGYMSNSVEEKYLNTDNGQDIIASAIYRAFRNYKEELENKSEEEVEDVKIDERMVEEIVENKVEDKVEDKVEEKVKEKDVAGIIGEEPPKKEETKVPIINTEKVKSRDTKKITYRIQVIASKEPIPSDSKNFKGVKGLNEIFKDGYYKYLTDPVSTYSESQDLKKRLSDKFPGAFVVAYLNDKKVPVSEARKMEK